ncbi:hypothetical protein COCNU_scaffold012968G000020 [Cocos nucifera]|nr:hypothetical protein [Cocos nucifera]
MAGRGGPAHLDSTTGSKCLLQVVDGSGWQRFYGQEEKGKRERRKDRSLTLALVVSLAPISGKHGERNPAKFGRKQEEERDDRSHLKRTNDQKCCGFALISTLVDALAMFFSGTHAITCALFALLRPGDELLAVAGAPYDTLEEVIGIRNSSSSGSLKDFGITYREVPLAEDGGLNWDVLALASQKPDCMVMVDNCYGEFVETCEPPVVGADLIAGSLIKNPGGTIAPCGGYVAGKKIWVEAAAARLSAPGLGVDCGSTPGDVMRALFQGLFLSPQMVGEAIKGGLLIAEVMASKGYKVQPIPRDPRHDTVQAVQLGSRERLISFCEAVQKNSPVGSFVKPTAGLTAGYASEV